MLGSRPALVLCSASAEFPPPMKQDRSWKIIQTIANTPMKGAILLMFHRRGDIDGEGEIFVCGPGAEEALSTPDNSRHSVESSRRIRVCPESLPAL